MDYKNRHLKINYFTCCCCILFFLFHTCYGQRNVKIEIVQFVPKESMQMLLDSFVKENRHENYVYELYIDKVMPHECNLILYTGKTSLTALENSNYKQTPLAYVMVSGIKIAIYSGIERYFENPANKFSLSMDTANINANLDYEDTIIWVIKDSFGVFNVSKVHRAYPFLLPTINFTPPDFLPNE